MRRCLIRTAMAVSGRGPSSSESASASDSASASLSASERACRRPRASTVTPTSPRRLPCQRQLGTEATPAAAPVPLSVCSPSGCSDASSRTSQAHSTSTEDGRVWLPPRSLHPGRPGSSMRRSGVHSSSATAASSGFAAATIAAAAPSSATGRSTAGCAARYPSTGRGRMLMGLNRDQQSIA